MSDIPLLHRSHDAALRAYLGSLGADAWEVDELVQRTWVKTCRAIGTFAGRSRISTWLHSIARREFLSYRAAGSARARRLHGTPIDDLEVPTPAKDATPADHIRAAVHRLPPRQREVVIRRFWYGMTCEEVAEQMGVSTGTIKSQTFKALRSLRVVLAPSHVNDA